MYQKGMKNGRGGEGRRRQEARRVIARDCTVACIIARAPEKSAIAREFVHPLKNVLSPLRYDLSSNADFSKHLPRAFTSSLLMIFACRGREIGFFLFLFLFLLLADLKLMEMHSSQRILYLYSSLNIYDEKRKILRSMMELFELYSVLLITIRKRYCL